MKKPNKAIKIIKKINKLTQLQMSKIMGCSLNTAKKVECGDLKLSRNFATRIEMHFGVNIEDLMQGEKANDLRGVAYTKEWADSWRGPGSRIFTNVESYLEWLRVLILAAQNKGRSDVVIESLIAWMNETRSNFGLEAATDAILRERKFKRTQKFRVGDMREMPPVARVWGFRNSTKLKDDDVIELTHEFHPGWAPSDFPPNANAQLKLKVK